jgi:hypothetical protein
MLSFTVQISREIRDYLTSVVGIRYQHQLKRAIFSSDVAIQTESPTLGHSPQFPQPYRRSNLDISNGQDSTPTASDLASILKWSKDISSDINLSSGTLYVNYAQYFSHCFLALQRLTEIATGLHLEVVNFDLSC